MTAAITRLKRIAGRLPGASLLLSLFAIALWCSPALSQWCEWDRTQPWQLWRWVTGHFCHWSGEHLAWDLIVFVVLGAIYERHDRAQFLINLAVAAVAITLATCLFLPNITTYRGLSGLDSTLFGWLAAKLFSDAISKQDKKLAVGTVVFTCAFIAKLAFEWTSASTVFVSSARSDFVPVPLAHAIGALAGVAGSAISQMRCVRGARNPGRPPRGTMLTTAISTATLPVQTMWAAANGTTQAPRSVTSHLRLFAVPHPRR